MINKNSKQAVLSTAKGYRRSFLVDEITSDGVETPFAERHCMFCIGYAEVGGEHTGSSEHRFDARKQFARGKRLKDVVVRTHLQPKYAVHLIAASG